MTRLQLSVVGMAIGLLVVLYFGCDTKTKDHIETEKRRALAIQSTDINALLLDAKKTLNASQANVILASETQLEQATADSSKINLLKQLSGQWYQAGRLGVAGFYAEEVAKLEETEEAWSITGTTFTICLQRMAEAKIKSYCSEQAVRAFENAISLNPNNAQHKVNLALVYVENPPTDNPMKGVLMLVDLNRQFPENVAVLTNLGRLAIQTSQFEKAKQRLEQALTLEPENQRATCLLSEVYKNLGDAENAQTFQLKCDKLSNIEKSSE